MKFFSISENNDKTQIDLEQKKNSQNLPLQISSEKGEILPPTNSQSEQEETEVQKTGAWAVFALSLIHI